MNSPNSPIDRRAVALAILSCFIVTLILATTQQWLPAALAAITTICLPLIVGLISRR